MLARELKRSPRIHEHEQQVVKHLSCCTFSLSLALWLRNRGMYTSTKTDIAFYIGSRRGP